MDRRHTSHVPVTPTAKGSYTPRSPECVPGSNPGVFSQAKHKTPHLSPSRRKPLPRTPDEEAARNAPRSGFSENKRLPYKPEATSSSLTNTSGSDRYVLASSSGEVKLAPRVRISKVTGRDVDDFERGQNEHISSASLKKTERLPPHSVELKKSVHDDLRSMHRGPSAHSRSNLLTPRPNSPFHSGMPIFEAVKQGAILRQQEYNYGRGDVTPTPSRPRVMGHPYTIYDSSMVEDIIPPEIANVTLFNLLSELDFEQEDIKRMAGPSGANCSIHEFAAAQLNKGASKDHVADQMERWAAAYIGTKADYLPPSLAGYFQKSKRVERR